MVKDKSGSIDTTADSRELWAKKAGGRGERIIHKVFDHDTFMDGFTEDLARARGLVLVQSPYVTTGRVERLSQVIKSCVDRGVQICVFIQQPREWSHRADRYHPATTLAKLNQMETAIRLLESYGVHVNLRLKVHEKLIVIDDNIFWDGTLNPLSHYDTSERLNRWVCRSIVKEGRLKHRLNSCSKCCKQDEFMFFSDEPSEKDAQILGTCIASNRKLAGLSQSQLAHLLGIHQSDISEIEAGKRKIPVSQFSQLCKLVGLRVVVVPEFFVPGIKRLVLPKQVPTEDARLAGSPTERGEIS